MVIELTPSVALINFGAQPDYPSVHLTLPARGVQSMEMCRQGAQPKAPPKGKCEAWPRALPNCGIQSLVPPCQSALPNQEAHPVNLLKNTV